MNGDERGIDCGGSCENLCLAQISDPVLLWSRAFKVSEGNYNAVAYIENPNFSAGVSRISYIFKLFDEENLLVAERKGRTFISPNGITPIFEGAIRTGERIPSRAFFEFSGAPQWAELTDERSSLSVSDIVLSDENSSPRVDALLSNDSIEDILDIEAVAVLFGADDNAIAVSSTFINRLSDRTSQNIVFTWPNKFDSSVSRIEIIPRTPLK
ncbi:MAG: hypothetical protein ACE5F2_01460 [Candidatus Paceibacteria bacterium]